MQIIIVHGGSILGKALEVNGGLSFSHSVSRRPNQL
jgi:hypothetical protein